jgi:predicted anti-sigma-YlaC factor YlaD
MHAACERARQWATAEVDGELSRFEIVLLKAHLDACPSCREFRAAIDGISTTLRATPLERLEQAIEVKRLRWRIRSRFAPAAAAMAVAAVVLGSSVVSGELRTGSVRGASAGGVDGVARISSVETMNLSKLSALTQPTTAGVRTLAVRSTGSLRGGPVFRER